MFEGLKARWQNHLDNVNAADPYRHVDEPAALPPAPVRRPASAVGKRDPYAQLAPERLDREWETGLRQSRPAPMARVRPYEVNASDWIRARLYEFDVVVARARRDMAEFVDRVNNLPAARRDWQTPQYSRRHARNMVATRDDERALVDGDKPGEVAQRMLARARRASSPEITGLIPVITPAMEEEAWA